MICRNIRLKVLQPITHLSQHRRCPGWFQPILTRRFEFLFEGIRRKNLGYSAAQLVHTHARTHAQCVFIHLPLKLNFGRHLRVCTRICLQLLPKGTTRDVCCSNILEALKLKIFAFRPLSTPRALVALESWSLPLPSTRPTFPAPQVSQLIATPALFPRIYISWISSQNVQNKFLHLRLARAGV